MSPVVLHGTEGTTSKLFHPGKCWESLGKEPHGTTFPGLTMNFPPDQRGSRGSQPLDGSIGNQASLLCCSVNSSIHTGICCSMSQPGSWHTEELLIALYLCPVPLQHLHPHSSIPLTWGTRSRKGWQQHGEELDCVN